MDDRDYDREREGGRYRSNTRTDASDDRRRSIWRDKIQRNFGKKSERSRILMTGTWKQMMKNWILTEQIIGGNAYDGENEQMVVCT